MEEETFGSPGERDRYTKGGREAERAGEEGCCGKGERFSKALNIPDKCSTTEILLKAYTLVL